MAKEQCLIALAPLLDRRIMINTKFAFDAIKNNAPEISRNRSRFYQIMSQATLAKMRVAFNKWTLKAATQTSITQANVIYTSKLMLISSPSYGLIR